MTKLENHQNKGIKTSKRDREGREPDETVRPWSISSERRTAIRPGHQMELCDVIISALSGGVLVCHLENTLDPDERRQAGGRAFV